MASCGGSAPFNAGPASADEDRVWGAARPGAKGKRCFDADDKVSAQEVAEWVDFMRAAGVRRVVSMLSASELATYAKPGLPAAMTAAFGAGGWANRDPKQDAAAPAAIMAALAAGAAAGERTLVHCWGGGGRTGLVLAAWLVTDRGMSPEAAADAVSSYAAQHGLARRVDVAGLTDFLARARAAAAGSNS